MQEARNFYHVQEKQRTNREEIQRATDKIAKLSRDLGGLFNGNVDPDLLQQLSQSIEGVYVCVHVFVCVTVCVCSCGHGNVCVCVCVCVRMHMPRQVCM